MKTERGSIALVVWLVLMLSAGLAIGYWWSRPSPVVETAAPAERQADGSLVLERTATNPDAKPAHKLPKGAKLERVASVTVQPDAKPVPKDDGHGNVMAWCPPVTVDLSLVRMPDQTRRVIASSRDGQVIAGLDVPVETPAIEDPPRWAAGLSYDPIHATPGAWVERDLWRVRVGAEFNQTRQRIAGPTGTEVRLRVGFTF